MGLPEGFIGPLMCCIAVMSLIYYLFAAMWWMCLCCDIDMRCQNEANDDLCC